MSSTIVTRTDNIVVTMGDQGPVGPTGPQGLPGGLSMPRSARTSNYTVISNDNGSNLALGGSAFFTLTFNAASGYPSTFAVIVTNEDSTRAKFVNGVSYAGFGGFYLWPGQSVLVYNSNNTWQVIGKTRWRPPAGSNPYVVNTDFTNGSDTYGAADGLGTGTGAFQTVNHACYMLDQEWDWTGYVEVDAKILMAAGSTDSTTVHFASHSLVGAHGSAALTIDMNGGTLSGGIQLFFGLVLRIRNGTILVQAGPTGGLSLNRGATVYILDGVSFASQAGVTQNISMEGQSRLQFVNSFTWSSAGGASAYFMFVNPGCLVDTAGAITATVAGNVTVATTVYVQGAYVNLQNITWSLGGNTVTATNKYNVIDNGVLRGSASVPGTGVGVTGSGGQAV